MAINKFMLAALKAASYADIDIKKSYKIERKLREILTPPLVFPYKISEHKIGRSGYNIPVRIFTPEKYLSKEVILFFHGGGWVTGNIESYTAACVNMAKYTGRRVMSVDYRLAPEHPFPCGLYDCYVAAKEVCTGTFGIIPGGEIEKVTLAGDSAGGNLAAAVSIMAKDRGEFEIPQQILFYPSVYDDHTPSSPFRSVIENGSDYLLTAKKICDYMDLYLPEVSKRKNPYFAPLLCDDLSGQPRTLVITAQYDPLRDEGEAYAEKLAAFGCDAVSYRMKDALHGFISLPSRFVHVRRSYEIVNRFLKGEDTFEQ